jgi:threonylcarbamoyladenosine tRNA methylthiotransferase MtaB
MSATRTRVAFYTLGCKVNQSETDLLARQFIAAGYDCVSFDDVADVYIINTCTVTHVADSKSRQVLRQAHRANPHALVVATGCYASIVGDALAQDGTLVIRNRDKWRLLPLVQQALQSTGAPIDTFGDPQKLELQGLSAQSPPDMRTRAMIKVQDGCNSACTYCIIPRARGRSRSVPPHQVIERVNAMVAEGHAEVVITGVDLGSYGEDEAEYPDLGGLVAQILAQTAVRRLRISSLEPGDFKREWLSLWQDQRLCRHLHVPLQAGSDSVLRRMERKYDTETFYAMISTCRDAIPGVTITTDVMVGFPGESEAEFEESYRFIEQCAFDGMHVFKYSRRPGTRAARFSDHVPESVKNERSARLRALAEIGRQQLVRRTLGREASVLWENQRDGIWRGLTDNNVRVFSDDPQLQPNRLTMCRLVAPYGDGCWGEVLEES